MDRYDVPILSLFMHIVQRTHKRSNTSEYLAFIFFSLFLYWFGFSLV